VGVLLVGMVEPHWPKSKAGRPPFAIETMLRIHYLQKWIGLSDQAMAEALHEVPIHSEFAKLDGVLDHLPDERTILRFRHLLEKHDLSTDMLRIVNDLMACKELLGKSGSAFGATLISAAKFNEERRRQARSRVHQTKKGNQCYFSMKAHIGVDADSGPTLRVEGTAANVNDVTQARKLLHGEEADAFADSGYQGAHKRPGATPDGKWHGAMRQGKRKVLNLTDPAQAVTDKIERIRASIRTKVEHTFRVIKKKFGYVKVGYRWMAKNTAKLKTLLMLSNLSMVRGKLMAAVA
jgi:IS5 family transposase